MASSAELYALRNDGSVRCFLRGFPTVRSYTRNGAAVAFLFFRATDSQVGVALPVTTVSLLPGQTARVLIGFGYYRCDVLHPPGRVVVTMPDDADPLRLPGVYPGASLCAHESVSVSPVFSNNIDPFQHGS